MIRRARSNPTRRSAFTLIEVLATLALIGIAIPAIMRGISLAAATASRAKHQAEAATLAEGKLEELMSLNEWNTGGSGDFGPEWPLYRWACQNISRDFDVTEVAVSVTWTERGAERSFVVSTLAYVNPNATTPAGGAR